MHQRPSTTRWHAAAWLALLLTLVATACGALQSDDDEASDESDQPVPDPGFTVPPVATVPQWDGDPIVVWDVEVGDCFNQWSFIENDRQVDITTREDCDRSHQREVYYFTEHPAVFGEPYPGDQEMRLYAEGICYDQFPAFVGELYELSELEIGVITPNETNFEDEAARYRGIHCYVLSGDGEEIVGSVRGSGR